MTIAPAVALMLIGAPDIGTAIPVEVIPAPSEVRPAAPPPARPEEKASAATPAPDEDPNTIVVTARENVPQDPGQAINAASFEAVTAVDNAVVAPLAMGYKKVLPNPARTGLRNVLRNLTEPVNFVNFLLQLKPGKAFETAGRFAINSTIGVAGLVDIAKSKSINLPYRANGFANTLGYYGVGPGPYLFLPVIGPSSARDLFGWVLDKSFLPTTAGSPFNKSAFALGTGVVKSLDDRVELDDKFKEFHATGDPYVAEREWYLAKRHAEIEALHGRGPLADAKKKPEAKVVPVP